MIRILNTISEIIEFTLGFRYTDILTDCINYPKKNEVLVITGK